jgi:hypothetical protein
MSSTFCPAIGHCPSDGQSAAPLRWATAPNVLITSVTVTAAAGAMTRVSTAPVHMSFANLPRSRFHDLASLPAGQVKGRHLMPVNQAAGQVP